MSDLSPILQPVIAVIGAVIAGLIAIYVPRAIAAFEKRTGIILTENQRQTILGAAQTAAGNLETMLDKGAISIKHIDVDNATVRQAATQAIGTVPEAATALGINIPDVARIIVGMVDTAAHGVTITAAPAGGVKV